VGLEAATKITWSVCDLNRNQENAEVTLIKNLRGLLRWGFAIGILAWRRQDPSFVWVLRRRTVRNSDRPILCILHTT
jgi:hypothetical protein